jgi:hypothetical protein
MKSLRRALLFLLTAFCFAGRIYGLTIPASEDTVGHLNKLTAGANAAPNLQVDAARTAFLYFNLDEVPQGAVLRWAKLRLFLPSVRVRGSGLGVHVVTGRWDEALPSSSQPQFSLSPVGIIPPEKLGTRRFVTVDVTSTVQAWINGGTLNEGFAIKAVSGGSATSSLYLTSKDGASLGLPAELDLDFKPDFSQLPDSIQQYFSPSFTTEPSVSVSNGIIGAETSGMGPMSYQWYINAPASRLKKSCRGVKSNFLSFLQKRCYTGRSPPGACLPWPQSPQSPQQFPWPDPSPHSPQRQIPYLVLQHVQPQ